MLPYSYCSGVVGAVTAAVFMADGLGVSAGTGGGGSASTSSAYFYQHFSSEVKLDQDHAADLCRVKGGWLATVTSEAEQTQLEKDLADVQPSSLTGSITGGRDAGLNATEGTWIWEHGPPGVQGKTFWQESSAQGVCQQDYCNWGHNQPESWRGRLSVRPQYMYPYYTADGVKAIHLEWFDVHSPGSAPEESSNYICQFPTQQFQYVYEHYTHTEKLVQDKAAALCGERGGWLATVTTAAEEAQLKKDLSGVQFLYLSAVMGGMQRTTNGSSTWVWRYGPPEVQGKVFSSSTSPCRQPYCNWKTGTHPDDLPATHDALGLQPVSGQGFQWTGIPPLDTADFICQFHAPAKYHYQHFEEPKRIYQDEAAALCGDRGGWLATVTTHAEQAQLIKDLGAVAFPNGGGAFLGGHDGDTEGTWVWKYGPPGVQGKTFWVKDTTSTGSCRQQFCNWDSHQPNSHQGSDQDALGIRVSGFRWGDAHRPTAHYICQFYAPEVKYRYEHFKENRRIDQEEAAALCSDKKGWLATVTTQAEHAKLRTDLGAVSFPHGGGAFIGGHDGDTEGTWVWKYGPPGVQGKTFWVKDTTSTGSCRQQFCNWDAHQPNSHQGSDQDALAIHQNLRWGDAHRTTAHYVCQFYAWHKTPITKSTHADFHFAGLSGTGAQALLASIIALCVVIFVAMNCLGWYALWRRRMRLRAKAARHPAWADSNIPFPGTEPTAADLAAMTADDTEMGKGGEGMTGITLATPLQSAPGSPLKPRAARSTPFSPISPVAEQAPSGPSFPDDDSALHPDPDHAPGMMIADPTVNRGAGGLLHKTALTTAVNPDPYSTADMDEVRSAMVIVEVPAKEESE